MAKQIKTRIVYKKDRKAEEELQKMRLEKRLSRIQNNYNELYQEISMLGFFQRKDRLITVLHTIVRRLELLEQERIVLRDMLERDGVVKNGKNTNKR